MEKDYYKILGINNNATQEEIKKAYRKKSKLYHPDTNLNKSAKEIKEREEKFKEVTCAYKVLSNPEKRKEYDNSLKSKQVPKEQPRKNTQPNKTTTAQSKTSTNSNNTYRHTTRNTQSTYQRKVTLNIKYNDLGQIIVDYFKSRNINIKYDLNVLKRYLNSNINAEIYPFTCIDSIGKSMLCIDKETINKILYNWLAKNNKKLNKINFNNDTITIDITNEHCIEKEINNSKIERKAFYDYNQLKELILNYYNTKGENISCNETYLKNYCSNRNRDIHPFTSNDKLGNASVNITKEDIVKIIFNYYAKQGFRINNIVMNDLISIKYQRDHLIKQENGIDNNPIKEVYINMDKIILIISKYCKDNKLSNINISKHPNKEFKAIISSYLESINYNLIDIKSEFNGFIIKYKKLINKDRIFNNNFNRYNNSSSYRRRI